MKERNKNKSLKEQLVKKNSQESSKESQQVIMKLKSHLEEFIKIEETYKRHREEKQFLEAERKEADKRENILTDHLQERTKDLNQLEEKFGQEKRRLQNETISLKIQLEEAK